MFKLNGNYSYIDPSFCISVSDFNTLRQSNPKSVIFTSLDKGKRILFMVKDKN